MKIKDIMTPEVEIVGPDASLQEAAAKMRSCDCGAVPVCDGKKVVGIITDRDIVVRAVAAGDDFFSKKVSDVMSRDVAYCFEDDDLSKAERLMEDKQIRRLIVLDASKQLAGIVSIGDLAVEGEQEAKVGEVLERVSEPGGGGRSFRSPSRPSGTSYGQNQGYGEAGQGRGTA